MMSCNDSQQDPEWLIEFYARPDWPADEVKDVYNVKAN